ncbi:DUF3592 domain-containing protein [Butyrivibrio sp.]|uniref:DUF3592 domain-containing protein n=1 Tax=Butyrivibrio sp. TaxID=28121 RepID=UPI0025C3A41F|nr:DUF3592 domain-containing protein [Butyrivibrio sp.]
MYSGGKNVRNRASFEQTTAEIISIESTYDTVTDSDDYHVAIKFNVEGKEIETSLGEYENSMYEGKEIGIYYNPDDPTDIIAASKTMPIVTITLGTISILVGIILFFRGLRAMP